MKSTTSSSLVILAVSSLTSHAAMIAEYNSGVSATAGTSGANDPATVAGGSWSGNGNGGGFRAAVDSGNGGWRITDGSGSGHVPQYNKVISSADVTDMQTQGWVLTFTATMAGDAIGDGVFSNNYYMPNNHARQNNNLILVEDGTQRYNFIFTANATGGILLNGNAIGGGSPATLANEVSDNSGTVETANFNLDYVEFTFTKQSGDSFGTLTTNLGDNFVVNSVASGQQRIYWGSGSSSGQGSTIWNAIELQTIPEPSSTALLGLGGMALLLRRRK